MSMLNQAAVEALCSATYLSNYLDCLDTLPDDLQRVISQMRELDMQIRDILSDIEHHKENYDRENTDSGVKRSILQIQRCLIRSQELGDEKLQLVSQIIEFIENRTRQLEQDLENLDSVTGTDRYNFKADTPVKGANHKNNPAVHTMVDIPKEVSHAPAPPKTNHTSHAKKEKQHHEKQQQQHTQQQKVEKNHRDDHTEAKQSERTTAKRQRRQKRERMDSVSKEEEKKEEKEKAKKKKKRKVKKEKDEKQADPPIDPDEPTYCLCDQVSYGEMIGCDNDACEIEWFHFNCVNLVNKPKGKWFCPNCRGDKSNVMKQMK